MTEMKSNVRFWKELQDNDYFEHHPCYNGLRNFDENTCSVIEGFQPLRSNMNVAVIGCGYGRDTLHIAPRVGHVFGIDVSEKVLAKATKYLSSNGVKNFTPILAERYKATIPDELDLVFSIVVMQHLTRDLVQDYFVNLQPKLRPGGAMVVQFLEDIVDRVAAGKDAELKAYEPSVSWTVAQLVELATKSELDFAQIRTIPASPAAVWHWAHFVRPYTRPTE